MLPASPVILLYITTPDVATAQVIGKKLVEMRLAACANILPAMQSIYHWQGAIETAEEAVLLLKTTAQTADSAQEKVRELHPYDCPCILQIKVDAGHPPYLQWLAQETLR